MTGVHRGWHRLRHALRYQPGGGDLALVVVLGAAAVVALLTGLDRETGFHYHRDDPWLWLATLAAVATLWWRRRRPVGAYAMVALLLLVLDLPGYRDNLVLFILVVLSYHVGAYARGRRAWWAVAATVGLLTVVVLSSPANSPLDGLVSATLLLTSGWVVGRLFRAREAALQHRLREVRTGAELARRRADLERVADRVRLAHELHDVIAHSISVVAVQAGVGRHLIDRDPEAAGAALDVIAGTTDTTLRELGTMVSGLYRAPGGADADGDAPGAGPTLVQLDALAAAVRSAGLDVSLRVEGGSLSEVPPAGSRVGYRLVQESLTNVLRHAPASRAEVTVRVDGEGDLEVLIVNDLPGAASPAPAPTAGGGQGLVGMHERVSRLGGSLRAGPVGDRFRVSARIPSAAAAPGTGAEATAAAPLRAAPAGLQGLLARARRTGQRSGDRLLAVANVLLAAVSLATTPVAEMGIRSTTAVTWALTLGVSALVAWRRRFPLAILAINQALIVVLLATRQASGSLLTVSILMLYALFAYRPQWEALTGTGLILATLVYVDVVGPAYISQVDRVIVILFLAGAVAVGWLARCRRALLDAELAEAEGEAEAARTAARLAGAAERLQLAGEVHDRVSRALRVIAEQTALARTSLETRPDEAATALGRISDISRDTLAELRGLLATLRAIDETVPAAALEPARVFNELIDAYELEQRTRVAGGASRGAA